MYSAKEPGQFVPRPLRLWQRIGLPSRQNSQSPQLTTGLTVTRSPTLNWLTPAPRAETIPTIS